MAKNGNIVRLVNVSGERYIQYEKLGVEMKLRHNNGAYVMFRKCWFRK